MRLKTPAGGRRHRRSAALATPEELRGAHPPRQLRSVDALQRIAVAARRLLTERDFEDVSIADIAAAAGISVGNFYLRFRSKDHLIAFLLGDVAEEMKAQVMRESESRDWAGASLEIVIAWFLGGMAEAFAKHRDLLRPATMIARQTRDRELLALISNFNSVVHERFRTLMLERAHLITHPDPPRAINVMLLSASAAIREVVLYAEPVSMLSPADRKALVKELTDGAVAYLTR